MDALRKLFAHSTDSFVPTPVGDTAADRNAYYTNLITLKNNSLIHDGYQVRNLALVSQSEMYSKAQSSTPEGLAYRYALRELNPFAIVGADYTRHNESHSLDLYNSGTGEGTWTLVALSDRAELLAKKLDLALSDGALSNEALSTHYADYRTGFDSGNVSSATNGIIFGDDRVGDVIAGYDGDDHLYGGDGADTIEGQAGNDYIEGNAGNDVLLSGGIGNDILLGQQGIDVLDGGDGNDTLDGGLDDDTLRGGAGVDRYYYRTNQGQDVIDDADRNGSIRFDNQVLQGGIHQAGAPANTYTSADGQFTYVANNNNLIVNGGLTIQNFVDGDLGIHLADTSGASTGAPPTINYENGVDFITYDGDETDNQPTFGAPLNHIVHGFGGNDLLDLSTSAALLNHQIHGEAGHDWLLGGAGQDRVSGEDGNDVINGGGGDDALTGGAGLDFLVGDTRGQTDGDDFLDGGDGDDTLEGTGGNDILLGGVG